MSVWSWLGPRLYDPFLGVAELRGMRSRRQALLADAGGHVLEVGAGTGLNLRHYPSVDRLVLTEPDPQMARRLKSRVARQAPAAQVVEAPAEELPFEEGSFDTVISTLVLCTVPLLMPALAEIRRVLRPNGRFLFIEHVRADSARLARWQDRLQPAWQPFGLGCHCNRDTVGTLLGAGWEVDEVQRFAWRGMPFLVKPVVAGWAAPPRP